MTATFTLTSATGRTPGDCLRIAVLIAYGDRYGFEYDDTPAVDPGELAGWAEQGPVWDAWAQTRGLGWWQSYTHAPVGADRWLAIIDSPGGPASHAVVMTHERLYADPANHFDRVTNQDVRSALLLGPAEGWPPLRCAPLVRPYRRPER